LLFGNLDAVTVVLRIPALLMAFTFHEFGHAWVATLLGDDTPRAQGRLTLSPLSHIDPLGALLILVTGFGWARPVQVNPSRLRFRPWGDIAVSLAGVAMNFLLGLIFYGLLLLAWKGLFGPNPVIARLFWEIVSLNLLLIGFNLIPVPPLDGFRVIRYLFPRSMDQVVYTLYRMGPVLLMLVLMTQWTAPVMHWIADHLLIVIHALVFPPVNYLYNLLR